MPNQTDQIISAEDCVYKCYSFKSVEPSYDCDDCFRILRNWMVIFSSYNSTDVSQLTKCIGTGNSIEQTS